LKQAKPDGPSIPGPSVTAPSVTGTDKSDLCVSLNINGVVTQPKPQQNSSSAQPSSQSRLSQRETDASPQVSNRLTTLKRRWKPEESLNTSVAPASSAAILAGSESVCKLQRFTHGCQNKRVLWQDNPSMHPGSAADFAAGEIISSTQRMEKQLSPEPNLLNGSSVAQNLLVAPPNSRTMSECKSPNPTVSKRTLSKLQRFTFNDPESSPLNNPSSTAVTPHSFLDERTENLFSGENELTDKDLELD